MTPTHKLAALLLSCLMLLSPLAGLAQAGDFPPLDEAGFLPAGQPEFIHIDAEAGLWRYASHELKIEITRRTIDKGPVRYLAAEIWVRPDSGEALRMYPHGEAFPTVDRAANVDKPASIARSKRLVFSMDGDYYLYRVGRSRQVKGYPIGVELRGGQILFDVPPSDKRTNYPPLDMIALFPDGDMRLYARNTITAEALQAQGARDVLSFGPVLVQDGEVNRSYTTYGTSLQPRAAIGMFEKGHYLALIVEGRIRESKGMTCVQVAELFAQLGCPDAFNLDGGWTSAMVFMGRQLNQLDRSGVRDNARPQAEVMGIGQTAYFDQEQGQ